MPDDASVSLIGEPTEAPLSKAPERRSGRYRAMPKSDSR